MKAVAAVTGASMALAVAWLLWLGSHRPAQEPHGPQPRPAPQPGAVGPALGRAGRLEAPLPPDERERRDYSMRRAPLMRDLRAACSGARADCTVADRLDTLDITLEEPWAVSGAKLRDRAIGLGAESYGFRRLRFFQVAKEGSGREPTLVAEVTLDSQGVWTTFMR